ncbi:MAG: L,D-transpeptidase family protein [Sphingomicrobium sp.]
MRAGPRPARIFSKSAGAAVAIMLTAASSSALAQAPAPPAVAAAATAAAVRAERIEDFYRARGGRPLFTASPTAVQQLLVLLNSAAIDGLDPRRYQYQRLTKALDETRSGKPRALNAAEWLLAQAFVTYASDLRRAPNVGIIYVDRTLMPDAPTPRALLEGAAAAPMLDSYIASMGWMNPIYVQLRRALDSGAYKDPLQYRSLALNLQRARTLPAGPGRYIVVNAAAQRLDTFERGKLVDSMKVVVGKTKNPTPMMAAYIRFASLNPYWNVPPDLAAERIAPNVLKEGLGYLKFKGYQVLSDWGDSPSVVDPKTIDWKGVAAGRVDIRVRQLPGPSNAMGQMKFMFPNSEGIYLHDTPEKEKLAEASRLFSGGCIRLEDAPRLGAWLFDQPLTPAAAGTEERVPLNQPVPVYVTYLTAIPSGSEITFIDDIYGRDAARTAQTDPSAVASR